MQETDHLDRPSYWANPIGSAIRRQDAATSDHPKSGLDPGPLSLIFGAEPPQKKDSYTYNQEPNFGFHHQVNNCI